MSKVVGEVRRSQLITTFGVGAMVDLPSLSTIVMGLDYWDKGSCEVIEEPRLLRAVQALLGPQVQSIRQAPTQPDTGPSQFPMDPCGVPTALFPKWLRCPLCSTLAHISSGVYKLQSEPYRVDKTRYIHASCTNKGLRTDSRMPAAVPARFIVACENGHLDDFPWEWFVHRGTSCASPKLRLFESGVSGEAADVYVVCEACSTPERKMARPLSDAFGQDNEVELSPCTGAHPHLNGTASSCSATKRKTLLIGASNSYFGLNLSALSIPRLEDPLAEKVSREWGKYGKVDGVAEIAMLRKFGQLGDLDRHDDSALWQAIQAVASGQSDEDAASDIKRPEWNLLSGGGDGGGQELIKMVPAQVPSRYSRYIERVVLVEKHIEVRALVGFTRIESAGDMSELDTLPQERRVPLSRKKSSWVPGALVRGEGIFIQLKESEVALWESSDAVLRREARLRQAHENWCRERPWMKSAPPFPGARYLLVHTLSHALIRELGIRCGYGTASINERIYSAPVSDVDGPMCGVFLSTASSDSEGTLGGLVSLGKPEEFGAILDVALERLRVCASDPLCATYDPEPRSKLHGAACHSCGFLPETSCERANRYLDRALLVETMAPTGAAFFGDAV